jgi:uncharacterized protein (TIGR01777 family)
MPDADPAASGASPPLVIAVAGATGMVGTALVASFVRDGHTVKRIGRGRGAVDITWDLETGRFDASALDGVEAVVNLTGETLAQRWTAERKRTILESRVRSTALLARAAAGRRSPPAVLIGISAVGYYGDRGDEVLDEQSGPGTGFLAEVARAWEDAADPAREAGIRVVHPRLGVVLSPAGGVLGRLVPVFRMGAGGRIGSGRQWMSWVTLTDVIRAMTFVMWGAGRGLSGAMNLTSPAPVRNAEFTSTLGAVLHRPAVAPIPAFVVRAVFGEMGASTILASQRALPRALERAGFQFLHPALPLALAHELSRPQ